jgi:hypothetical protein
MSISRTATSPHCFTSPNLIPSTRATPQPISNLDTQSLFHLSYLWQRSNTLTPPIRRREVRHRPPRRRTLRLIPKHVRLGCPQPTRRRNARRVHPQRARIAALVTHGRDARFCGRSSARTDLLFGDWDASSADDGLLPHAVVASAGVRGEEVGFAFAAGGVGFSLAAPFLLAAAFA